MSREDPIRADQARVALEVGFVIIGRNEGRRLRACIRSLLPQAVTLVYVDSGSSDDSVKFAQRHGIPVIELDASRPFTAARARNTGAEWLEERFPGLAFVHFIDGDCELVEGWVDAAMQAMRGEPWLGAVCGRRRERDPEASPYNRLCDAEWNTPVGVADTVGGDALFRMEAFRDGGGFSELIAGEEPDLCHRVRKAGWRIRRIDHEMTIHDAAMTRFAQWWQRSRRSGYATAEALSRRGMNNPKMWREVVSNIFWALPVAWPLWPVLWWRIYRRRGVLEANFITLGKLPHLQGTVDYWRSRKRLIEYK